ncbi:MAG: SPASM domain-containing protein, partial [Zoogloea sp.]|nr:SPASM domain-containing protein [Zoogloea sp.]
WTAATARLNHAAVDQVLAGQTPLVARDLYRVAAHHLEGDQRHYPCLAGQGILAVSPAGDVYPCDHFVGLSAFRMGNVHDDDFPGERFLRVSERMEWNLVEARPRCTNCRIRHLCGGECPAHSYLRQGDIAEPSPCHCAQTKPALRQMEERLAEPMADPGGRARLQAWLRGD